MSYILRPINVGLKLEFSDSCVHTGLGWFWSLWFGAVTSDPGLLSCGCLGSCVLGLFLSHSGVWDWVCVGRRHSYAGLAGGGKGWEGLEEGLGQTGRKFQSTWSEVWRAEALADSDSVLRGGWEDSKGCWIWANNRVAARRMTCSLGPVERSRSRESEPSLWRTAFGVGSLQREGVERSVDVLQRTPGSGTSHCLIHQMIPRLPAGPPCKSAPLHHVVI